MQSAFAQALGHLPRVPRAMQPRYLPALTLALATTFDCLATCASRWRRACRPADRYSTTLPSSAALSGVGRTTALRASGSAAGAAPAGGGGEYVLAFSSVPDSAVARTVSDALVRARLAACVATLPGVTSTYRWRGKVETSAELMLVIKTRAQLMDQVGDMVRSLHPYEVPELVAVPVVSGLPEYLRWMAEETAPDEGGGGGEVR
jgi:periplasmic divalent cation tolerance protein